MDDAQAHRKLVTLMTPTFRAAARAARGDEKGGLVVMVSRVSVLLATATAAAQS